LFIKQITPSKLNGSCIWAKWKYSKKENEEVNWAKTTDEKKKKKKKKSRKAALKKRNLYKRKKAAAIDRNKMTKEKSTIKVLHNFYQYYNRFLQTQKSKVKKGQEKKRNWKENRFAHNRCNSYINVALVAN